MRKIRVLGLLLVSLLVMAASANAAPATNRNFNAHLAGQNEVPAVDTQAQGEFIGNLSKDGLSLDYKLIASNIDNVIAGHIHLAPEGVNGPIVAFLFTPQACVTQNNGVRCEGTITAANLLGPLAGHPLSDLITAMETGRTYANVHTTAHPGGEMRGQIR